MVEGQVTISNRLLDALPQTDRQRCLGSCEAIELVRGRVLAKPGQPIRAVHFPAGSTIGLTTPRSSRGEHAGLGVALVGAEGMLGTSLSLGIGSAPLDASVHGSGLALRMDTASFRLALDQCTRLRPTLNRYLHVVMSQTVRSIACSRFHRVEARLAKWLLMMQDRLLPHELYATHAFLADVLGVRRVGVTVAATALQRRGLIGYRRGEITILHRAGLQAASCWCYAADNADYAQMLARGAPLAMTARRTTRRCVR